MKDPIYGAFGDAVATRRKALGLTQAQLAGKVGMSRASIANIESGRQNILLHHVYALASALEFGKVAELLPAMPQRQAGRDLKMALTNQIYSNHRLSETGAAQVAELIASALPPRRGGKSG